MLNPVSCARRFMAPSAAILLFAFTLLAPAAQAAPRISGTPPASVVVDTSYRFRPAASDAGGSSLRFSIRNKPAWATFSPATGLLTGKPTRIATHTGIEIRVSNGRVSTALSPFSIKVTSYNRPPTISGTPATSVNAGNTYSFTPRASDPEGKRLTFSIAGRPSWSSFDSSTGRLQGTPTAAMAGSYGGIVISVSDGWNRVSLPTFSIRVVASNRAPVISGAPATTATVGNPYSFRPTASDADGDRLTFSIANRPSWATFDAANGTLYGTPTASNVGTYANVRISVSDGPTTTSLAPFTISVTQTATRTATISWTPPTRNMDGTPITNLAGYRVSYGTAPASYTATVGVTGATVRSVVIEGLTAGTWYFAVRAVTSTGVVSNFSNEARATL